MIAAQLLQGVLASDIDPEHRDLFERLRKLGAVVEEEGLWRLHSLYRIGRIHIGRDGQGYVEAQTKAQRDLLIEPEHIDNARPGDTVLARRFLARRGRTSGEVVAVLHRAHTYLILYSRRHENGEMGLHDLRNDMSVTASVPGIDLRVFKEGTVFKVDPSENTLLEIFGHLDDPNIDEKLSLALYERRDAFSPACLQQAKTVETAVNVTDHPDRVDLRELDFCTIDPVTAKDFDDAIYYDTDTCTLYVAIADVSHYVPFFSPIDREAVQRGFTTYLPHKAFPMLPRELSENICSLKPRVDRLAFVAKIVLDPQTLEPAEETFFEAIIHSKFRFHYDAVDGILTKGYHGDDPALLRILPWLLPLQKLTEKLRTKRMKRGFDFRSDEIKLTLNDAMLLEHTQVETGTPSHSLIEECMLLANRAAAKRFGGEGDGIFRIHEPPKIESIEKLLGELSAIGIHVEEYEEAPDLIRTIQQQAQKLGLAAEVDALLIRSLKQASYSAHNVGHFGLGFDFYSHFTSPIRRYPDLILHHLIKAQLQFDKQEADYLLRNIDPLCARVSRLERDATRAEWDFRDRKFARWALEQKGKFLDAEVIELDGERTRVRLLGEIQGVEAILPRGDEMLFDTIRVMITQVDLARPTVRAERIVDVPARI